MHARLFFPSFILALIVATGALRAQIIAWRHPDTCRYFYSSHIRDFPPSRPDMPQSIRHSWIVLDSLCKNAGSADLSHRLSTLPKDSLRLALKCIYELSDDDPLLFDQYTYELGDQHIPWKQKPASILQALLNSYSHKFGEVGEVIRLIFEADHIMHAYVADQSMQTVFDPEPPPVGGWNDTFCADLIPIEYLKGGTLYFSCASIPGFGGGPLKQTHKPCIRTTWTRSSLRTAVTRGDTLKLLQYGSDYLKVGSEYFVFLFHYPIASFTDHYTWITNGFAPGFHPGNPIMEKRELFFPIANGIVLDEDNIFGYGTRVPIDVFERNLRSALDSIIGEK